MTKRRVTLVVIGILILGMIGYLVYRQWLDPARYPAGTSRELEVAGTVPNQVLSDIPLMVRNELKVWGGPRVWPTEDYKRILGTVYCPLLEKSYYSEHMRLTTTQINPDYVSYYGSENESMAAELGIEYVRSIRLLDDAYATSRGLRIGDDKTRFEELYQQSYEEQSLSYETAGVFRLSITITDGIVTGIVSANHGLSNGQFQMERREGV